MGVLTKQIDIIMDKKRKLKEQINILKKQETEEDSKLANIESSLNISVLTCKKCFGKGQVSSSGGYGGCTTEYYPCSTCEGKGYIVSEKLIDDRR